MLDIETSLSSLSKCGQLAGSIGVALEGTMVSGLMPFGPAFDHIHVGDVIETVDGVVVTPGTIISAISGEDESDVALQLRRKRGGSVTTLHLVRTCSARLLTSHSLAVGLHNVLVLLSDAAGNAGQPVVGQQTELANPCNPEACQMLEECARLLRDLQTQMTRSESKNRRSLSTAQKGMVLACGKLKQKLSELTSAKSGEILNVVELERAKEQAEQDRETLMSGTVCKRKGGGENIRDVLLAPTGDFLFKVSLALLCACSLSMCLCLFSHVLIHVHSHTDTRAHTRSHAHAHTHKHTLIIWHFYVQFSKIPR